jgi:hypothetical protein
LEPQGDNVVNGGASIFVAENAACLWSPYFLDSSEFQPVIFLSHAKEKALISSGFLLPEPHRVFRTLSSAPVPDGHGGPYRKFLLGGHKAGPGDGPAQPGPGVV